jgi:hypothetical protein
MHRRFRRTANHPTGCNSHRSTWRRTGPDHIQMADSERRGTHEAEIRLDLPAEAIKTASYSRRAARNHGERCRGLKGSSVEKLRHLTPVRHIAARVFAGTGALPVVTRTSALELRHAWTTFRPNLFKATGRRPKKCQNNFCGKVPCRQASWVSHRRLSTDKDCAARISEDPI